VRTALDSNILSALWSSEPSAPTIARRLGEAKQEGALLLSPIAYAELHAHPRSTKEFLDTFLADSGIRVDFHLLEQAWTEAGLRFARYADRRRRSAGESSKRLLADFVVGAHALLLADRLMTLDAARYTRDFPELLLFPIDV
jgi:predicted nucleic acid-binding protein